MEQDSAEKKRGGWGKLFSARDWTKYPLGMTIVLLIVIWRVTTNTLENKVESLQQLLNKCQEARTLDAKERTDQDRRILDRYIDQQLERSAEKIIQPKIDSISNL